MLKEFWLWKKQKPKLKVKDYKEKVKANKIIYLKFYDKNILKSQVLLTKEEKLQEDLSSL